MPTCSPTTTSWSAWPTPSATTSAGQWLADGYASATGVVLVDEFQDTDPLQWKVVRQAFGDGRTRLVLIGDPKQAVYSFRGADVYAYLDAARAAEPERRFTLEENWRSDAGLLEAYDALFEPAPSRPSRDRVPQGVCHPGPPASRASRMPR